MAGQAAACLSYQKAGGQKTDARTVLGLGAENRGCGRFGLGEGGIFV